MEHGNLRELALARMRDLGTTCRDVRTREVGIQEIHNKVRPDEESARLIQPYPLKWKWDSGESHFTLVGETVGVNVLLYRYIFAWIDVVSRKVLINGTVNFRHREQ